MFISAYLIRKETQTNSALECSFRKRKFHIQLQTMQYLVVLYGIGNGRLKNDITP